MMKRTKAVVGILIAISLGCIPAPAGAVDNASGMERYPSGLMFRGSNRTADSIDATRRFQAGRIENVVRMVRAGKTVPVGPSENSANLRGLYIELHAWWGTADLIATAEGQDRRTLESDQRSTESDEP